MSYQDLINKKQRIVFGFHGLGISAHDTFQEFHWKSNLNNNGWLNKPNLQAGLEKLDEKLEKSQKNENQMHCVATSLTPKNKEYVKTGVKKYLPMTKSKDKSKLSSSIIKLGREMNAYIPKKINSTYHGIVYCDSPDHSGAFNHLINLNTESKEKDRRRSRRT
jgi:hypothetical protein